MMMLFLAVTGVTLWWFTRLPTGFLPTEDQGYVIVGIQLPDAASQARTRVVVDAVSSVLKKTPGVESWFLIGGMSILDGAVASNAAAMYITFIPWSERTGRPGLSQEELIETIGSQCKPIREASIFAFPPP